MHHAMHPLLLALIVQLALVHAQWGPIVKLSTNEVSVAQNENMGQCIAVQGNTVHVVWYDTISSSTNAAVFYKRSLDGGTTWGTDVRLSPAPPVVDGDPLLAVCGSYVHVVFWRNPYNTQSGISPPTASYYIRSADGGSTWQPEVLLANNYTFWPGVACSGSYVYINLNNDVTASNSEVFFRASPDNGTTWGSTVQISNANGRSEDPAMSASGNYVYLAWNDNRADLTNLQLYYRYSTDNGATWSNETSMTALPNQKCYSPTVASNGATVVTAIDNPITSFITTRISSDYGATFTPAASIESIPNAAYPLVAIDQTNNMHITFGILSGGQNNYYMNSTDGGSTWSTPQLVATWPSAVPFSGPTFIAVEGTTIHLTWAMLNATGGHKALYYTNNAVGSSTTTAGTAAGATTAAGGTTTSATAAPSPSSTSVANSGPFVSLILMLGIIVGLALV